MATGTARSAQERRPASAPYITRITVRRQSLIPALIPALILAPILAVPFLAASPFPAAAFEVEGIRFPARGGGVRLVLDLSADAPFRAFALHAPDRAVVDMPAPSKAPGLPARRPGPVSGLRAGAFEEGVWRLVLDLDRPMRIEAARVWAPSHGRGHRLVVDLAPRRAGAPDGATFGNWEPQAALPVAPLPRLPPDLDRPTVVIDPGHGGVDPGAIGLSGIREKAVVLEFAATLALRLAASGKYNVRLTRNDDRFLPLRKRVAIGQAARADLFISLHADSVARKSARGASIYTLSSKGSDGLARELANRENKADLVAGLEFDGDADVAGHLIDMQQRSAANRSVEFARLLLFELGVRGPLLRRPHRSAAFRVLKSPNVPSVLIELGFLSNLSDERRLRRHATREEVADAIETALARYFAAQRG